MARFIFEICNEFKIKPVEACARLALRVPGVKSIALSITHAYRVKENIELIQVNIPIQFWQALKAKSLIALDFEQWLIERNSFYNLKEKFNENINLHKTG